MLFNPSHPGEVLKDYLGDMTVKEAAKRLGVTRPNLSRILNGHAGISAVMSVRLAKAMPHTSPEFWLKMQLNYDLSKAQKSRLPRVKPFPFFDPPNPEPGQGVPPECERPKKQKARKKEKAADRHPR